MVRREKAEGLKPQHRGHMPGQKKGLHLAFRVVGESAERRRDELVQGEDAEVVKPLRPRSQD